MPITNTTRIIDLPTKSSLGSGDYFAVDNENGDTSKILATSVSGSSTAGLVAKEYSNAQTYDKGDYCIHVENNVPGLYRANQDIPTAETWTAAHWDPTDAGSELTTANADIASLNQNLTEKFATITGTFPSTSGFANMNYPTGYTVNNCVLVSAEVYYSSSWRSLVGITAENVPTRFFTQLGSQVSLYNNSPSLYGATVRVTLMRTDI